MEQFEDGENFPAKIEKAYYNVYYFYVLPINIVDNIDETLIIDTGSDSDFI